MKNFFNNFLHAILSIFKITLIKKLAFPRYYYFVTFFIIFGLFISLCILIFFVRSSRIIPFQLNELSFYILLGICITYIYNIKILFLPPKTSNFLAIFISKIITKIFNILLHTLLHNQFISDINIQIMIEISNKLKPISLKKYVIYIYYIYLLPSIFLLLIFIVDIIYFKELKYFFHMIFILIFPMLYTIFIRYITFCEQYSYGILEMLYIGINLLDHEYSFYVRTQLYNELDEDIPYYTKDEAMNENSDPEEIIYDITDNIIYERYSSNGIYTKYYRKPPYHDTFVTIRKYIELDYLNFIDFVNNQDVRNYYTSYPVSTEKRYNQLAKKLNKKRKDLSLCENNILNKDFYIFYPIVENFYYFFKGTHEYVINNYYIPIIKNVITIIYAILWIYLLIISIGTVQDFYYTNCLVEYLSKYNIENPF